MKKNNKDLVESKGELPNYFIVTFIDKLTELYRTFKNDCEVKYGYDISKEYYWLDIRMRYGNSEYKDTIVFYDNTPLKDMIIEFDEIIDKGKQLLEK